MSPPVSTGDSVNTQHSRDDIVRNSLQPDHGRDSVTTTQNRQNHSLTNILLRLQDAPV